MRYIILAIFLTACISIGDPLGIAPSRRDPGCPVEEIDMEEVPNMDSFLQRVDSRCKALFGPDACLRKIVQKDGERNYWAYCAHRS